MRPIALALALVLAAPLAAAGEGWGVARLVTSGSADPKQAFEAFDTASLNVFDFDGDGTPEIVSQNDNNRVYVIDSGSGKIRAEIVTTHPEGWAARGINGVAIGDLYGDGVPCLVIPNSAAYLSAWCYQGKSLLGKLKFERRWEVYVDGAALEKGFREAHPWIWSDKDPSNDIPGMDGNAFLADVDGEPGLEVFVETDGYPGQFSFTHDGKYRWSKSFWDGNAGAVVADLDGDGKKEAVFASDAGVVTAYDASTGAIEWTFEAAKNGATPGSITVAPAIADLDGDGKLEVVFSARNVVATSDPAWRERSHAVYFALRHDGRVLWKQSADWMNPLSYNHPALVDVDGDKRLDLVYLDWNTAGHKPGDWEPTKRGPNLFALRGKDGGVLWHVSVPGYWSNKDVAIADGRILLVEERNGREGIGERDLRSGSSLAWHALPDGWQPMRGPVAFQSGGSLKLVVPLGRASDAENYRELDVGLREGALVVLDTGVDVEPAWSANFLNADAAAKPMPKAGARIPAPGAALALAAIALVAWRGRRR